MSSIPSLREQDKRARLRRLWSPSFSWRRKSHRSLGTASRPLCGSGRCCSRAEGSVRTPAEFHESGAQRKKSSPSRIARLPTQANSPSTGRASPFRRSMAHSDLVLPRGLMHRTSDKIEPSCPSQPRRNGISFSGTQTMHRTAIGILKPV